MTTINFYHLTKTGIEKALPKLLEKALDADFQIMLLTPSKKDTEIIDKFLWNYEENSFLPHGTEKDGDFEFQPIFITESMNENKNSANLLTIVNDAEILDDKLSNFEKILLIFDGNDKEITKSIRQQWTEFKEKNFELSYFQQNEKGGWEKKV